MSQLKLSGDASGTGIVTVAAPNTNSTYTVTLPAAAGTIVTGAAGSNTQVQYNNAGAFAGSANFTFDGTNIAVASRTFGRGAATSGGVNNVAAGQNALSSNTTGEFSIAMGYNALAAQTIGSSNTGLGNAALATVISGNNNTGVGRNAFANTTASDNTGVGYFAGTNTTTGANNTAVGSGALQSNTTASNNTAVGYQALYASNRTADTNGYNTAIGYGSGSAITTGQKNTIIGAYSGNQGGLDIRTSSNNIVLSDGDGNPNFISGYYPTAASTYSAATRAVTMGLGGSSATRDGNLFLNGSTASGWGPTVAGRADGAGVWFVGSYSVLVSGTNQYLTCMNTSGGVYLNGASATSWTAVSDETRKVIIEPITDAANKVATLRTVIGRLKTDEEDVRRPYLIAQDVQAVLPEAVSETEDRDGPVLGLSYTETIPLLVAAIKELKSELDTVKAELAALKGN